MKTLYESILTNTSDKVAGVKDVIHNLPPTNKDWKRPDKHNWQLNFRCPKTVQKHINVLQDDMFRITAINPFKLKKENLTTIRCVINSYHRSTHVELICDDTPDNTPGVNLIGLDEFLNSISVANAKKNILDVFNRIDKDPELFGRILEHVCKSLFTLNKYQYADEKYIWEIQ
jgi:dipeptidase